MRSTSLSATRHVAPEFTQAIHDYPMLSSDEELALARAWRERHDVTASHKLVTSHLRLVAKIAFGYRGYGLPLSELVSEGSIGLLQAVRRFDPERGFRLSTYATWWIRAAIQEHILHSWSLVKIGTTRAQKTLFFNLRRLKRKLHAIDDGDLSPEQVGKIVHLLDVPANEVINMNRRLGGADYSLNAGVEPGADDQWQDLLIDGTDSQEASLAEREELAGRKKVLSAALKTLNQREQHILSERWLKDDPTTLETLANHYDVSRERVRQIEVRALTKLRKAMDALVHPTPKARRHPAAKAPAAFQECVTMDLETAI
jgi:RNA polymerase sigma-32 factor